MRLKTNQSILQSILAISNVLPGQERKCPFLEIWLKSKTDSRRQSHADLQLKDRHCRNRLGSIAGLKYSITMNSMNLVRGPALKPWGYNAAGMTPGHHRNTSNPPSRQPRSTGNFVHFSQDVNRNTVTCGGVAMLAVTLSYCLLTDVVGATFFRSSSLYPSSFLSLKAVAHKWGTVIYKIEIIEKIWFFSGLSVDSTFA